MARGNQRENDRAKAQKKLEGMKKPTVSGSSLKARQELDAENMRKKELVAAEKKKIEAEIIAAGGTVPIQVVNKGTKAPIKK